MNPKIHQVEKPIGNENHVNSSYSTTDNYHLTIFSSTLAYIQIEDVFTENAPASVN